MVSGQEEEISTEASIDGKARKTDCTKILFTAADSVMVCKKEWCCFGILEQGLNRLKVLLHKQRRQVRKYFRKIKELADEFVLGVFLGEIV